MMSEEELTMQVRGDKLGLGSRWSGTYGMSSVLGAGEVNHAINASEGGAVAAVSMRIELLLGKDVTTRL
jgi:hypothetical protein